MAEEAELREAEKSTDNSGEKQQENTESRLQQDSHGSTTDAANAMRERAEQSQGLVTKGVLPDLSFSVHEASKGPAKASRESTPGESVEPERSQNKNLSDVHVFQNASPKETSKESQKEDGSKITTFPDGSQIVKDKNGLPTEVRSDPNADGKQLTIKAKFDGKDIGDLKSVDIGGRIQLNKVGEGWEMTKKLPDGTSETTKQAADRVSIDPKTGAVTIDWKNGATTDGSISTEINRNFGSRSVLPDGTEKKDGFPGVNRPEERKPTREGAASNISRDIIRDEKTMRPSYESKDRLQRSLDEALKDVPPSRIASAGRELEKMVNEKLEAAGTDTRVSFGPDGKARFMENVRMDGKEQLPRRFAK